MTTDYAHRRQKLVQYLAPNQLLFISKPSHIAYFCGFNFIIPSQEREAFLLIHQQFTGLIHSAFSPLPDKDILLGVELFKNVSANPLYEHLQLILKKVPDISEILVDENNLTLAEHKTLAQTSLPTTHFPENQTIWRLRGQKDESELSVLKKAGQIASRTYELIKPQLAVGQTEKQIAQLIDRQMQDLGADEPAFPTIVAFGANSALPHHQPGTSVLKDNTPILIDFGARVGGYCSDMSRSFWFGKNIDPEYQAALDQVLQAYNSAASTLGTALENNQILSSKDAPIVQKRDQAPDLLTYKTLDLAARKVLAQADLDKFFIHTTGHGVGLDIHEPPSISSNNSDFVTTNSAITIEPGVYLEGKFGVRYENTLFVGEDDVEVLTQKTPQSSDLSF